jgi:hypothetical protein
MKTFGLRYLQTALLLLILFAHNTLANATDYHLEMTAFFDHVDDTYPFFDLKGIRGSWAKTKRELLDDAVSCESDTDFMSLVQRAIGALRDSHIRIRESRATIPKPPPRFNPGLSFIPVTGDRVAIMWASERHSKSLSPGTIITKIHGENAHEYLNRATREAWASGFQPSHQRAQLFSYRLPLQSDQGVKHSIAYLDGEIEKSLSLISESEVRGWPHNYNLPRNLTRSGRSIWYTLLPENTGYLYLRRIDDSIVEGMDAATKAHPAVRGWVVDLRGNSGGGYGQEFIDRIKKLSRPVSVIIDAGCASAGETVARDFRRYAGATLYGSRTAGSSSAKHTWNFPSGIASLTLPTRSRWRTDGEPIEFNGIEPDVIVEPTPEDLAAGENTAIKRAVAGVLSVKSMPIRRPN